jgi:hypothetical protein
VNKIIKRLANIHPFLVFSTEGGVLIELDAVLVEEERLTNNLLLLSVLKFAEGANQGVILSIAKGTALVEDEVRREQVADLFEGHDVFVIFINSI